MVLGMFPSFMGMTAVYLLMTQFGLINRLTGLILIYAAGAPMGYLTQKGFFDTIPKAIDEAAKIDGATNMQVFLKINPAAFEADHRLYGTDFVYLAMERFYPAETSVKGEGSLHRRGRADESR